MGLTVPLAVDHVRVNPGADVLAALPTHPLGTSSLFLLKPLLLRQSRRFFLALGREYLPSSHGSDSTGISPARKAMAPFADCTDRSKDPAADGHAGLPAEQAVNNDCPQLRKAMLSGEDVFGEVRTGEAFRQRPPHCEGLPLLSASGSASV